MVDWNIDRGLQLDGVIAFLASTKADLILLQEVDLNARRTRQLNVAREIAQKLRMNYIFGRGFQELTQGSEASPAFHGQATLSPWPLSNPRILRFRRQSNFWRPRWFLPDFEPFQEDLAAGYLWWPRRASPAKGLSPITFTSRAAATMLCAVPNLTSAFTMLNATGRLSHNPRGRL